MLSLYDGRSICGTIQQVGQRWRATDANGNLVGIFATQTEAMRALYDGGAS